MEPDSSDASVAATAADTLSPPALAIPRSAATSPADDKVSPADDKVSPAAGTVSPADDTAAAFGGRKWLRRIVSAVLLYHVVALVIVPASVRPSSQVLQTTARAFQPYLQSLYLDHGFHFFAPEPSYSTLVGYTLEFPDGTTQTGRFPNRGIFPRLMYHRHFMLTEFLGFVPDEEEGAWHRSYARHLGKATGATHVSLSRITHYLPTPETVRSGKTLNDSESFSEVPVGRFTCDEL